MSVGYKKYLFEKLTEGYSVTREMLKGTIIS
jgi:hypothetical protein